MLESTTKDEATAPTILNPRVRKLRLGLLGPATEDDEYAPYCEIDRGSRPPNTTRPCRRKEQRPRDMAGADETGPPATRR